MIEFGVVEFIKNFKFYIISALLLAIMIVMAIFFSSVLENNYSRLGVLEDYLTENGLFRSTYNVFLPWNGMDSDLSGINDLFTIKKANTSLKTNNKYENVDILVYKEDTINKYKPELIEGTWLDKYHNIINYIPCVISKNGVNLKVGDSFKINGIKKDFLVVGEIMDGTTILGYGFDYHITDKDYEAFYEMHYYDLVQSMVVIIGDNYSDYFNSLDFSQDNKAIFVYSDNISEDQKEDNLDVVNSTGIGIEGGKFKENSYQKFLNSIEMYCPIFIASVICCFITICVIAILNYRKNQNTICIYQLCGMNNTHYYMMCFTLSAIIIMFGLVFSLILYIILNNILPFWMKPHFNIIQVMLTVIISFVFLIVHEIVFITMHRNTTIGKKLHERGSII